MQLRTEKENGYPIGVDEGVLVVEVAPGGPADAAGIRGGSERVRWGSSVVMLGGDVITAINGQPAKTIRDYTVLLETQSRPGDTVTLTLDRAGETVTVQAVTAERPQGNP